MEKNEYPLMYKMEQSHWWFAGKRRLVENILGGSFKKEETQNAILDIGCGTGMVLDAMTDYGRVYGLDFSSQALRFTKARGRHRLTCSDANVGIPFKDNAFHIVTCLDVLEHLDNDRRAVEEMYRVCAPGGLVMITVPAFEVQWSPHDVAIHHKRRYTKRQLLRITAGLNWDAVKSSYYNMTFFLPILAVRKLRALFPTNDTPESDFSLALPACINTLFAFIFKTEIRCLNYFDPPFGVSLLVVLRKAHG